MLTITDLERNEELDREALSRVYGGRRPGAAAGFFESMSARYGYAEYGQRQNDYAFQGDGLGQSAAGFSPL